MVQKDQDRSNLPDSSFSQPMITHLSEHFNQLETFPNLDQVVESFNQPNFTHLSLRKRFRQINQILCQLIQQAPSPSFLLSAVLDFFDKVNQEKLLNEPLTLASFEFWLNHFSDLSEADNYEIRAKIVGKYVPREEYQNFFPIGMGKTYSGTHFVAAHLSPDVDTMIASFWGWMDAFSARVGTGMHFWCLPGGPPDSPVTSIFRDLFGHGVFPHLARTLPSLTLTAMDLVSQKQLSKQLGDTVISTIDHGPNDKAIILVNEQGHYLGDWRSSDVEIVRQISILFKSCLHWFENNFHANLISLLAKSDLSKQDLVSFNSSIFDIKIQDCEPAQDFNEKQKEHLHDFFYKILGVEKGLEGTFRDFNEALVRLNLHEMLSFQKEVEAISSSDIFDKNGHLIESRPLIFNYLQKLIQSLDHAIFIVRNYVERLDVVLNIKYKVLQLPYVYITLRSDVDEMRLKMQDYDFLTVVIQEQDGTLFPVGIVSAKNVRHNGLGTVSLRDFCNLEEVRMASYLEVISVVDHHKTSLKTPAVPTALIGDAQSCNVLIAEQAFLLNDKYSLGGMNTEHIDRQIQEVSLQLTNPSQMRILQRLLQRRMNAQYPNLFYIHPEREFKEYLCYLQAILDDTDLLSKVSSRDLECVMQLLNRLKSLSLNREVEIVHFDDIPRDHQFTKTAAKRILKQTDMYSLYKKVYSVRESEVESHLKLCSDGKVSNIFLDTKEQNNCARVGQTKVFSSNFPFFMTHASNVRQVWLNKAKEVYKEKAEVDLHLHMISTITSAEEVYQDQLSTYPHQDELWFWTPSSQQGYNHLNSFLSGFQQAVKKFENSLTLEFLGSPSQEWIKIFNQHFPHVPQKITTGDVNETVAILRFKAGALNSRKSMITPFLPRIA